MPDREGPEHEVDAPLIRVEGLGKRYCRTLRRSLWYGVQDIARSLNPWSSGRDPSSLRAQEFWALRDISFELRRGECLGLIGGNGSGKSTLLKLLNGLLHPDTGSIRTRGKVGALIELNAGFNPLLTGRENIFIFGAILGLDRTEIEDRFDAIVDFAGIPEFIDTPVQSYSSGMRVRLGFAVAAQMRPDILLIDEVLAVGDLEFRLRCLNAVGEMMENAAVIFVSHQMAHVQRICTRVIHLEDGAIDIDTLDVSEGIDHYLRSAPASEPRTAHLSELEIVDLSDPAAPRRSLGLHERRDHRCPGERISHIRGDNAPWIERPARDHHRVGLGRRNPRSSP